jgi:hypothetical protein
VQEAQAKSPIAIGRSQPDKPISYPLVFFARFGLIAVAGLADLERMTGVPDAQRCNDPLKTCSGVNFPEGDTDERNDGRRDQALDRPTQVGAGP